MNNSQTWFTPAEIALVHAMIADGCGVLVVGPMGPQKGCLIRLLAEMRPHQHPLRVIDIRGETSYIDPRATPWHIGDQQPLHAILPLDGSVYPVVHQVWTASDEAVHTWMQAAWQTGGIATFPAGSDAAIRAEAIAAWQSYTIRPLLILDLAETKTEPGLRVARLLVVREIPPEDWDMES